MNPEDFTNIDYFWSIRNTWKRGFPAWYDPRADYETNAKSYYDYLARHQHEYAILVDLVNKLLRREIQFVDTDTIDFMQNGNWENFDDIIVSANTNVANLIDTTDAGNMLVTGKDGKLYVNYHAKVADDTKDILMISDVSRETNDFVQYFSMNKKVAEALSKIANLNNGIFETFERFDGDIPEADGDWQTLTFKNWREYDYMRVTIIDGTSTYVNLINVQSMIQHNSYEGFVMTDLIGGVEGNTFSGRVDIEMNFRITPNGTLDQFDMHQGFAMIFMEIPDGEATVGKTHRLYGNEAKDYWEEHITANLDERPYVKEIDFVKESKLV